MEIENVQVTQEDNLALRQIKMMLEVIEATWSKISPELQQAILTQHTENHSLNHCIRWGQKASEEIVDMLDVSDYQN